MIRCTLACIDFNIQEGKVADQQNEPGLPADIKRFIKNVQEAGIVSKNNTFFVIFRGLLKSIEHFKTEQRRIVKKKRSVGIEERGEEGAVRERSVNEGKSLSVVAKRGAAAGR